LAKGCARRRFLVRDAIVRLQQQGGREKARWHTRAPVVQDVERGELVIAEHLAALSSQKAIKRIATDEVEVEIIRLEEAALVRTFPEHHQPPSAPATVSGHSRRSAQACRPHF